MVVAGRLLQVLQRLLAEGHGHLVAALRGVLDDQVVQRAQPRGDLVAALLRGGGGAAVRLLDCRDGTCQPRPRAPPAPPTPREPARQPSASGGHRRRVGVAQCPRREH